VPCKQAERDSQIRIEAASAEDLTANLAAPMQQPPSDPSTELPIWKGRRGLINTAFCLALSLPCAFGLWFLAERTTIIPACSAYASAHGIT
jgi:hypothetical protein